jgi:hypothetical protein
MLLSFIGVSYFKLYFMILHFQKLFTYGGLFLYEKSAKICQDVVLKKGVVICSVSDIVAGISR